MHCTFDGATLAPTDKKPFDPWAEGLSAQRMEAAGIEPASRSSRPEASTYIVGRLVLASAGSGRQDPASASPSKVSQSTRRTEVDR